MRWLSRIFDWLRPKPAPRRRQPAGAGPDFLNRMVQESTQRIDEMERNQPGIIVSSLASMMQDALAKLDAGEDEQALPLLDDVIQFGERRVASTWDPKLAWVVALAFDEKAEVLLQAGRCRDALPLFARAIALCETQVRRGEEQTGTHGCLAHAYFGHGVAAGNQGDHGTSRESFETAARHYDHLVQEDGRRDLASTQAKTYRNLGLAVLHADDDQPRASAHLDRAVAILEQLVEVEGRRDLAGVLGETRRDRERVAGKPAGDLVVRGRSLGGMRYSPLFSSARLKRRLVIGPYTAELFGEVEGYPEILGGGIEYTYLLAVSDQLGVRLWVAAEVDEGCRQPGVGSHFLGAFPGEGHLNFGNDEDWGDLDTFCRGAIEVAKRHFHLAPDTPVTFEVVEDAA